MNPDLPGLNVYGLNENQHVVPLYISKKLIPSDFNVDSNFVNLLLLEDEVGEELHYTWIKNFNRLVAFKGNNSKCCLFCLSPFLKNGHDKRIDHMRLCQMKQICKVICPKNMNASFTQYQYSIPVPITLYADFECILKPLESSGNMRWNICLNVNTLITQTRILVKPKNMFHLASV